MFITKNKILCYKNKELCYTIKEKKKQRKYNRLLYYTNSFLRLYSLPR
jgi:hypothetical protein